MPDIGTEFLPEDVQELQPAARFLYRELDEAGEERSYTHLRNVTGLSPKTVRRAAARLEEIGQAERRWRTDDARERVVALVDEEDTGDEREQFVAPRRP